MLGMPPARDAFRAPLMFPKWQQSARGSCQAPGDEAGRERVARTNRICDSYRYARQHDLFAAAVQGQNAVLTASHQDALEIKAAKQLFNSCALA